MEDSNAWPGPEIRALLQLMTAAEIEMLAEAIRRVKLPECGYGTVTLTIEHGAVTKIAHEVSLLVKRARTE